MTRRYFQDMDEFAESDVVIVGAGSAGLACAYELGKIAPHLKVGRGSAHHLFSYCMVQRSCRTLTPIVFLQASVVVYK